MDPNKLSPGNNLEQYLAQWNATQKNDTSVDNHTMFLVGMIADKQISDGDLAQFLVGIGMMSSIKQKNGFADNEDINRAFKQQRSCDNMSSFIKRTKKQVTSQPVQTTKLQETETIKTIYGGVKGSMFFQNYKSKVVFPHASKYLQELKAKPINSTQQAAVFREFLLELGKHREHIAIETNTNFATDFGLPFEKLKQKAPQGVLMQDRLKMFPAWEKVVVDKYFTPLDKDEIEA